MNKILKILEQNLKPKYENDTFTWIQIKNALMKENFDLVPIKIDGIIHMVKPIVTINQIKELAGANKDYYQVKFINKPPSWGDKEPCDNEFIDLNQPGSKFLEFECVRKIKIGM